MQMPTLLVAIFAGGSIGAVARYGLAGFVYARVGPAFPWGTLCVNVTGSVALGLLLPLLHDEAALTPLRAFITVGAIGAFTTFSTFAYEAALLLREASHARAAAYVAASVLLGLLGLTVGFLIATLLS